MKLPLILAGASVLGAAFLLTRPADVPPKPTTKARPRAPANDAPFWNSAVIPEPDNFPTLPIVPVVPLEITNIDHPSEVARLAASGDLSALNFALAAWFDTDPVAARDWLGGCESLQLYQPALTMIAGKIAQAGDPAHALEWAALLTPGPAQEQSLFDIYAIAARGRLFTEADLKTAPLPEDRIDALLSGAAGD